MNSWVAVGWDLCCLDCRSILNVLVRYIHLQTLSQGRIRNISGCNYSWTRTINKRYHLWFPKGGE